MKKERKRKIYRSVKFKLIFFIFLTFAMNSFAWFVYTSKVSNSLSAKVKSWHVNFVTDGDVSEEIIEMNLEFLYPGMHDFEKSVTIFNKGEIDAQISYEVVSASILGEELVIPENGSNAILNDFANSYPFKITINETNNIIPANTGSSTITFAVKWPYESGDDAKDTDWGTRAYDFHEAHPDQKSITLFVKIKVNQISE